MIYFSLKRDEVVVLVAVYAKAENKGTPTLFASPTALYDVSACVDDVRESRIIMQCAR